jgi:hypothetical protein
LILLAIGPSSNGVSVRMKQMPSAQDPRAHSGGRAVEKLRRKDRLDKQ